MAIRFWEGDVVYHDKDFDVLEVPCRRSRWRWSSIRNHDDSHEQFLRGDFPPTVALRVPARFLRVHPEFVWLNRLQCLAVGELDSENSQAGRDVYGAMR